MTIGDHYILRGFCKEQKAFAYTVAVLPTTGSYPTAGQIIDGKWRVEEILQSPNPHEYWIRVMHLPATSS